MLQEYLAGTNPLDADDFPAPEIRYEAGFVGQYFTGTEFNNLVYRQRDSEINFN